MIRDTISRFLPATQSAQPPVIRVEDLYAIGAETGAEFTQPPQEYGAWNGDKFFDGFGPTKIDWTDYWELRQRSAQLFRENLYARGIVRRLVTNVINTGLTLEANPEESVLGLEPGALDEWSERIEDRWHVWEKTPKLCDFHEQRTWGQIQKIVELEALVVGDILRVIRVDPTTGLPRVQLISGWLVSTPLGRTTLAQGNRIVDGVELDRHDRQVAYWIAQADGSHKRIPAFGPRTGRRIAQLIYGIDKRLDQVRGEPLLAIILQSLREIDRQRDATQRKAVVNSMLAVFIKRAEEKLGSKPLTGGAVRRDSGSVKKPGETKSRYYDIVKQHPGLALETLQPGEEPVGFHNQGVDEKFGDFEAAIVQALAWALEIPPEILRLSFNANYSASQAAINEFKIFLNARRTDRGENFCQPVYIEWMLGQAMRRRIDAPQMLAAFRDPARREEFAAWTMADWSGAIKLSTDIHKQARGYGLLLQDGLITHERAARELTGQKFTRNVRKLKRERELLAEAAEPLAEFKQRYGGDASDTVADALSTVDRTPLSNEDD